MISLSRYKEILDSGLLLDHYFILCSINNGEKIDVSRRVQGFINLLTKKGYLQDEQLTEKAIGLLQDCEAVAAEPVNTKTANFAQWVEELHGKCQKLLLQLTGKTQIRDKINGRAYAFLPNVQDLGKTLIRAITLYKLKDYSKIEKTLLKYIEESSNSKSWFPILQYYIIKDGTSRMVTDMQSEEEEMEESRNGIQKLL
jgi:hypothetical protein